MTNEQSKVHLASQWKLMWWKFKRHRVAYYCGIFLALMYASTLFSEFLHPTICTRGTSKPFMRRRSVFTSFMTGNSWGPFVYGRSAAST